MKFFIDYFGCRSNQAEAQEWIIFLENSGYQYTTSISEANFAILNTCCVTEQAEKEVMGYLKRNYRNSRCPWFVAGCVVAKEKKWLQQRYLNYFFFDNGEKSALLEKIKEIFPSTANLIYHSAFKSRVFVKVQDGCNFRCAFCIVPFLRGKSQSLSYERIVGKVEYYISLGYKEVVLTGINLSSFGYDLFPRQNLLTLIKNVHDIKGLEILRLSSLDPRFIKYQMIKELHDLPKMADSFHFSIQSGSDAILKAMKRGGKVLENRQIIDWFRRFFPDANMGADIIVGFPGEEEREFQKSLRFFEESELNYLHIFPFSPRQGTWAASLAQIPREIVQRRVKELKEANLKKKMLFRENMIGKTLEGIMIEENPSYSLVLSKNFLSVRVPPLTGYKKKKMQVEVVRVVNENLCEGKIQ